MVDTPPEMPEKRLGQRFLVPIVLLVSALVAIVLVFQWGNRAKPIRQVQFEGLVVLGPDSIFEFLGLEKETPDTSNWMEWETKLLLHPRIHKVRVRRDPEGFLHIKIEEKVAEFVVHIGNSLYEVDESLQILSKDNVLANHLIVITGNFPVAEGKIEGTQIMDITRDLRQAFTTYPKLKNRISEITIENDGEHLLFTYSPSRIKVYLGDKLSLYSFRKLYASLAYLENEGISAGSIDLRGEDAVYH